MEENKEEAFAFQIDLEEYFDHLERTERPKKMHSTASARVTKNLLKKFSSEEVESLSQTKFSLSSGTGLMRKPKAKQTSFKNQPRKRDSMDSISSSSDEAIDQLAAAAAEKNARKDKIKKQSGKSYARLAKPAAGNAQ